MPPPPAPMVPAIAQTPLKDNENIIPLQPNFNDTPNFDIMQLLSHLDDDTSIENVVQAVVPMDNREIGQAAPPPSTQNTSNVSNVMQCNSPMSNSCRIGQINININKK